MMFLELQDLSSAIRILVKALLFDEETEAAGKH
jgi:hypothetical protein